MGREIEEAKLRMECVKLSESMLKGATRSTKSIVQMAREFERYVLGKANEAANAETVEAED